MHWTVILFLISLIINGIIVYLLRNSHEYYDNEPIKFPLIIWILIVFVISGYGEGDIEFNDDFWLTQEY